jgi:hypothetical protein
MRIGARSHWLGTAVLAAFGYAAGCSGNSETQRSNATPADDASTPKKDGSFPANDDAAATDAAATIDGNRVNEDATANDGGSVQDGNPPNDVVPCTVGPPWRGLVYCTEGYYHRPVAEACGPSHTERPRPPGTCNPSQLTPSDNNTCLKDADCTAHSGGRCNYFVPGTTAGPSAGCTCHYICTSDADCSAGFLCQCDGNYPGTDTGTCVQASCRTDADCSSKLCASTIVGPSCARTFSCVSESDTCRFDADCRVGVRCQLDPATGARTCGGLAGRCIY